MGASSWRPSTSGPISSSGQQQEVNNMEEELSGMSQIVARGLARAVPHQEQFGTPLMRERLGLGLEALGTREERPLAPISMLSRRRRELDEAQKEELMTMQQDIQVQLRHQRFMVNFIQQLPELQEADPAIDPMPVAVAQTAQQVLVSLIEQDQAIERLCADNHLVGPADKSAGADDFSSRPAPRTPNLDSASRSNSSTLAAPLQKPPIALRIAEAIGNLGNTAEFTVGPEYGAGPPSARGNQADPMETRLLTQRLQVKDPEPVGGGGADAAAGTATAIAVKTPTRPAPANPPSSSSSCSEAAPMEAMIPALRGNIMSADERLLGKRAPGREERGWIDIALRRMFRSLGPAALESLVDSFREWRLPPCVAIVKQGAPVSTGPGLSVLLRGVVDVLLCPKGSKEIEKVCTYDRCGQCFGEIELFYDAPQGQTGHRKAHWASIVTRTPATLWVISRNVLRSTLPGASSASCITAPDKNGCTLPNEPQQINVARQLEMAQGAPKRFTMTMV